MSPAEPVVFRLRRWRLWLRTAMIVGPTILLIRGLAMVAVVAAGIPLDPSDYIEAVLVAVATAAAAGGGALIGAGPRPSWVRTSAAGLELAMSRHRAVFLPWAAVGSVQLRFAGPFTQLVVTPADLNALRLADEPGRMPWLRRGAFFVDVGTMTPGPAALRAEVNRRRSAGLPAPS